MSDRSYRFILGISIIISLFLEVNIVVYFIIGIMSIEFITNQHVPLLITRLFKLNKNDPSHCEDRSCTAFIYIDAERIFSLVVAIFISFGSIFYINELWFFPWFVGLNLALSGITGICPLTIMLRKIGFK